MNSFDSIALIVLLLSALIGYKLGFIRMLLSLIVLASAVFMALYYYSFLSNWLSKLFTVTIDVRNIISCFLLAVSTLLFFIIFSIPIKKWMAPFHKKAFNKIAGIIPGIGMALIMLLMAGRLITNFYPTSITSNNFINSEFNNRLSLIDDWTIQSLLHLQRTQAEEVMTAASTSPSMEKPANLSFVTSFYIIRKDLEKQMLEWVNKERTIRGIQPLQPDAALTIVARKHAEDMFKRGYFSHNTPEGIDPFTRLRRSNIIYLYAGENLALAPTLTMAHRGLMNSVGHKANILNKKFNKIGIGILDAGSHGLMITQEFKD
jgi:uncharacterized protein YkwD